MDLGLHTTRLRYIASRLAGKQTRLSDIATVRDVICAEEPYVSRPSLFLPGQLEKVTGGLYASNEELIAHALGGVRQWGGSVRYEIEDAVLLDGSVYVGSTRHFLRDHRDVTGARDVEHLERATLVSSFHGCHFFGHWLMDDCASYLLVEEGSLPIAVETPLWVDQAKYADYFDLNWTPVRRAKIGRLTWFADLSHHSDKARRYRLLRKQLGRRFKPASPGGIVYLKRGATGEFRAPVNEDEITEILAKKGVQVLEMEKAPLETTLGLLLGADLVIGVEGSNLTHALHTLREGGGIIALHSPSRFFNAHKDWADALGMRYGFVIGDETSAGYSVDPDDLLRTIDLFVRSRQHA